MGMPHRLTLLRPAKTVLVVRPDKIRAHLKRRPFQPIRVYTSDGSSYGIRHPEMMFVTRREMVIWLDPGDDRIPDRSA